MVGLAIDGELCIGCGRCVRACATAGIEVIDRVARPTDGCVLCGACVEACPVGAIAIDRGTRGAEGASGYRGVWDVAELDRAGALAQVSLELAGCAGPWPMSSETRCACSCPSARRRARKARDAARQMAEDLVAAGADEVRCCLDGRLGAPDVAVHARWICDLTRRDRPAILLIGATAWGRVLAPPSPCVWRRVSRPIAPCWGSTPRPGSCSRRARRSAATSWRRSSALRTVPRWHRPARSLPRAPARPRPPLRDPSRRAPVSRGGPAGPRARLRARGRRAPTSREPRCSWWWGAASAPRRTCRSSSVWRACSVRSWAAPAPSSRRLARLRTPGGTDRRLGGAPGAAEFRGLGRHQHLAGIGGAQTVIAVNEDSAAPIFGAARYRVVGDAIEVARQLVEQLEARASGGDAAASA